MSSRWSSVSAASSAFSSAFSLSSIYSSSGGSVGSNFSGRIRNELDNTSISSGLPASNFDVSSLIGRDSRVSASRTQYVPSSSFSYKVSTDLASTRSSSTSHRTISSLPGVRSHSSATYGTHARIRTSVFNSSKNPTRSSHSTRRH